MIGREAVRKRQHRGRDAPLISPEELLARLPDAPRWVEVRGILLSGRGRILEAGPGPDDFVVERRELPALLAVSGRPRLASLALQAARSGARTVLAPPESADDVGRALEGWKQERALLHRRTVTVPAPTAAEEARLLTARDLESLGHLPEELRIELETAVGFSAAAAVFRDGAPVSFAYAGSQTETLWDVSIDTLMPYRGRGLAPACVAFLIAHMARLGKEPVWGAVESNTASLRLAQKLGFTVVDEIAVFEPPA